MTREEFRASQRASERHRVRVIRTEGLRPETMVPSRSGGAYVVAKDGSLRWPNRQRLTKAEKKAAKRARHRA